MLEHILSALHFVEPAIALDEDQMNEMAVIQAAYIHWMTNLHFVWQH